MKLRILIIMLVVAMLLMSQVTPAFASCRLIVKYLVYEQCNTQRWCWWYDGRIERLYDHGYDCTGDGYIDTWILKFEDGPCCNI